MPRAVSLSSAGQSNVPPMTITFQYECQGQDPYQSRLYGRDKSDLGHGHNRQTVQRRPDLHRRRQRDLSLGNNFYWAVPPDDQPARVPSQAGDSVTWDLHTVTGGQESRIGTVTFTATTNIGGTWQATGIDVHGTWGN